MIDHSYTQLANGIRAHCGGSENSNGDRAQRAGILKYICEKTDLSDVEAKEKYRVLVFQRRMPSKH